MMAFEWMDQVGDGLVVCALMLVCLGLAVACAPAAPGRRVAAVAKRSRLGTRH